MTISASNWKFSNFLEFSQPSTSKNQPPGLTTENNPSILEIKKLLIIMVFAYSSLSHVNKNIWIRFCMIINRFSVENPGIRLIQKVIRRNVRKWLTLIANS